MGWTRYELLARHVDVNCTGEAEDPQVLLLRTNTTITKTIVYYYSGTQKNLQCLQTALPYITKILNYIVVRRKDKILLTRGRNALGKPNLQTNKLRQSTNWIRNLRLVTDAQRYITYKRSLEKIIVNRTPETRSCKLGKPDRKSICTKMTSCTQLLSNTNYPSYPDPLQDPSLSSQCRHKINIKPKNTKIWSVSESNCDRERLSALAKSR